MRTIQKVEAVLDEVLSTLLPERRLLVTSEDSDGMNPMAVAAETTTYWVRKGANKKGSEFLHAVCDMLHNFELPLDEGTDSQ